MVGLEITANLQLPHGLGLGGAAQMNALDANGVPPSSDASEKTPLLALGKGTVGVKKNVVHMKGRQAHQCVLGPLDRYGADRGVRSAEAVGFKVTDEAVMDAGG